jgi:GTP-binding protein
MKFIDYAKIYLKAGDGGSGAITFRREKFIPKGGPDGGDGGQGANIVFLASNNINTLLDFKYRQRYEAPKGANGMKSNKTGKDGQDIIIKVPVGTVVKDAETEEIIADLSKNNQKEVIAQGGRGGKGNFYFRSATNQTPRYAQPGTPGQEKDVILELKLIADVGLVGYPNAGKSTLISVLSAAKPKIADYPFTTLIPNLGIVKVDERKSFVMADIPGLIEGAAEGKGLGHRFLRHVERTKVLVFLIDSNSETPVEDYEVLYNELLKYNDDMRLKPQMICFTKIDSITEERLEEIKNIEFPNNKKAMNISSVSHTNLEPLKRAIWDYVNQSEE